MALKSEDQYLGDFLKWEADGRYSRDQVTVLSGQNLKAGAVVGKVTLGAATPAAVAGNTGNGTIGAVTVAAGAKASVYRLNCFAVEVNAGKFTVEDPAGVLVGVATVAVAFSGGGLGFTIADGAADFVAGDGFTITVAAGSAKVKSSADTAADGSDAAVGVLVAAVDASAADKPGVIVARLAAISPHGLTYDASVNDATKKAAKHAQLAAAGILVREGA